jgi:hypothetical protein
MQIARVILLAGVTAAALGALGVLRGAVGPKARVGALMLVAAGVAAAGIAVGLVGSARLTATGGHSGAAQRGGRQTNSLHARLQRRSGPGVPASRVPEISA